MDVHELRIGNYVTDQWNSTPSIVTSINEKGIDLEIEDDGNWPECARHWIEATTKSEEIFGVPLTEEILIKCGFESDLITMGKDGFPLCIGIYADGLYLCHDISYRFGQKLEHLHTFQNVFFDLTGQELEVSL